MRLVWTLWIVFLGMYLVSATVIILPSDSGGGTEIVSKNITSLLEYSDTPNSFGSFGECMLVSNTEDSVTFGDCLNGDNYVWDQVTVTNDVHVDILKDECIEGEFEVIELAQDATVASNTFLEFEGNIDNNANHGRIIPFDGVITYWNIYASFDNCQSNPAAFILLKVNNTVIGTLEFPDQGTVFPRPMNLEFDEEYLNYNVSKGDIIQWSVTTFSCVMVADWSPPVDPVSLVVVERRCD